MNTNFKFLLSGALALGLAGCAQPGYITHQDVGTVAGGIAGGALGSAVFHGHGQTAGIIGGTIICALIGSSIGQSMDRQDQLNAQQALINTPMGQEASWTNQKSGANYTVRPVNVYRSGEKHCRRALTTVTIDGRRDQAYMTVCRVDNGPWHVQN
jgi:surface antigen